jgi:two-component system response regulator YesN
VYKLLIADDQEKERAGITKLLRQFDFAFEVKQARNGLEALELIKKENFDILVTDIKMPFLNGIELIEKVHRLGRKLIYIIYSAYGEFEYAQSAITFGVLRYLLKPISLDSFKETFMEAEKLCRETVHSAVQMNTGSGKDAGIGEMEGSPSANHIIRMTKELVQAHYSDYGLGLAWLAEELHLSPAYLSAFFKSETGQNLVKYITDYRLSKAKELLKRTNLRIGDVGIHVGYTNGSYFIKKFREREGMSPYQYREKGCSHD